MITTQCQLYTLTAKWQSNDKSNFLNARTIKRVKFQFWGKKKADPFVEYSDLLLDTFVVAVN